MNAEEKVFKKKKPISIAADAEVREMLETFATRSERTVSWIGNEVLRRGLGLLNSRELERLITSPENVSNLDKRREGKDAQRNGSTDTDPRAGHNTD